MMIRFWLMAGTAIMMTGCSLAPDYQRPDVSVNQDWRYGETSTDSVINPDWWRNFNNPELDSLMTMALDNNLDLRAALQRVEQSRASVRVANASLFPTVNASSGASRNSSNPGDGPSSTSESWRAGFDVAYEVDLFGANQAGRDATQAQFESTIYDRDALGLIVMGDVAQTYFTLVNLRDRIAIAEQNLNNARELLRIVQARYDAGSISALDLSRQKTSLANNEASVTSLRQQVANVENALSVLLGISPQDLGLAGNTLRDTAIPAIAPGQPSTLLERRPDIRSAEAGLIAANADIGAARAAFFPSLSLGVDSGIAAAFGDPISTTLGLAASLAAPIFQGGRLEGELDRTQARQLELIENYRKTIVVAFQEVEDALVAAKAAREREALFETAAREAQTTYTLSRQLYDAGSVDFQTLLDAQNSLFSTQDNLSSVRLDSLSASIDLYKALGGGWQAP